MKRGLLFVVFCLGLVGAEAQNWALPSSTWVCNYSWWGSNSSYTLKVEKDTIIENVSCKIVGDSYTSIITYASNDTVYFYLNNHFRGTYYFNANLGDTVSYWNSDFPCTPKDTLIKAIVVKIDTVVLSNQSLRSFHTIIVRDSTGITIQYPDTITYTEKIGSNYIYPYFYPNCIADEGSYGICDYGDSTVTGFYLGLNGACSTGIQSAITIQQFAIYPNPATTQLNISVDESLVGAELNIYNVTGTVVTKFQISNSKSQIDCTGFANGIYIAEIKLHDTVQRVKWVKM